MTNLSIDLLLERVQDSRTREYMDEVLSCYYSGNYRSAVVMLYSVVMCDLIYKLQRIADLYQDKTSEDILTRLDELQTKNPTSPEWENKLREELLQNKRVLTPVEFVHLEELQKERHLCAHPVIKNNAKLHRPSKAEVYALIITALDEILTKPALLDRKLLELILDDIADKRSIFKQASEFKDYIEPKFLNRFASPEIEHKLIVNLWKIVFRDDSKDARANRTINFWFLKILIKRNEKQLHDIVSNNSEKLSERVDLNNPKILSLFIVLMNSFPDIYKGLSNPFKVAFKAKVDKLESVRKIAFFIHKDEMAYFESLLSDLSSDDEWKYMMKFARSRFSEEDAMRVPVAIFANSDSFNDAGWNYNEFIAPYLSSFLIRNLTDLLDAIKHNNQIRGCYSVQDEYSRIKKAVLKLNPKFDFTPYDFIS